MVGGTDRKFLQNMAVCGHRIAPQPVEFAVKTEIYLSSYNIRSWRELNARERIEPTGTDLRST